MGSVKSVVWVPMSWHSKTRACLHGVFCLTVWVGICAWLLFSSELAAIYATIQSYIREGTIVIIFLKRPRSPQKNSIKQQTENYWIVYLKNLTRHLLTTFSTDIPDVFFMRTVGGIFNYWSSSIKKNTLFFSSGWMLIIFLLIRIHPPLFSLSPLLSHSIRQ